MTVRESKLLGAVFCGAATLFLVNGLGYLIAGGGSGYNSAQGAASLFFMMSLVALPVGLVLGTLAGGFLAGGRGGR